MEHYTIRRIRLQVRHEDGTDEWLEAELHEGCHTVIVGRDACHTIGTYYREPGGGLTPAQEGAQAVRPTWSMNDTPALDVDFDEEPSAVATRAGLDLLEYRGGKWFCR